MRCERLREQTRRSSRYPLRDQESKQHQIHDDCNQYIVLFCLPTLPSLIFPLSLSLVSELHRQTALLSRGEAVAQETRGFDESKAQTFKLRSKEDAPDYRYMPDPNLPPLLLTPVRTETSPLLLLKVPSFSPMIGIHLASPGNAPPTPVRYPGEPSRAWPIVP
jgi:hypothetical protein